ncbi:MAG: hypothetical protein PHI35_07080 [Victivallaceae bacterium]|nr:hypothetical protein [Victivallaceae bacterium]
MAIAKHCIKNGIMFSDGNPVFALGNAYYGSFNPKKTPFPAGCDRHEEMLKDLTEMRECGFNLIRTAALGETERAADGSIKMNFDETDWMLKLIEDKIGLPVIIRYQGYGCNYSNQTNFLMIDQHNNPMPSPPESTFLPFCLQNPVVRRDNAEMTGAVAGHFRKFPSVVCSMMFNEPHYFWCDIDRDTPFYDFSFFAIQSWREWMVANGYRTREEAKCLDPLRRAPIISIPEEVDRFARWLEFRALEVNRFICDMGDVARDAFPEAEVTTCQHGWIIRPGSAMMGLEYFELARRLDFMGITEYLPAVGPGFYLGALTLSVEESAAAVFGKHAWLIEYNGHSELTPLEWIRETVAAIGFGIKGIVYYNFRADCPVDGTPEPELYGLLYSDRRRTKKYDTVVACNKLVTRLQQYFVGAEKRRSGVAILTSLYSRTRGYALAGLSDQVTINTKRIFTELLDAGVSVDFVRACDLEKNPLETKVLFVPSWQMLSETERKEVKEFERRGGRFFTYDFGFFGGFLCGEPPQMIFDGNIIPLDAPGALVKAGVTPLYRCGESRLNVGLLSACDNSFITAAIVNTDSLERASAPTTLEIRLRDGENFTSVKLNTIESSRDLEFTVAGQYIKISLPEIESAAFVIIGKNQ